MLKSWPFGKECLFLRRDEKRDRQVVLFSIGVSILHGNDEDEQRREKNKTKKKNKKMNGAIATLTLLNVMAIVCWLYFYFTDRHNAQSAQSDI